MTSAATRWPFGRLGASGSAAMRSRGPWSSTSSRCRRDWRRPRLLQVVLRQVRGIEPDGLRGRPDVPAHEDAAWQRIVFLGLE